MAAAETNEQRRKELLTFTICGAGFSGVEMASEFAESFERTFLPRYHMKQEDITINLVDSSPRILGALEEKAANKSFKYLEKTLKINIILNAKISSVQENELFLDNNERSIKSHLII